MPATLTNTGIQFDDGTSQSTSALGVRGQVFTASGTFTVPTGVTAVKVTVVGGGGGGGGNSGVPCGSVFYGGGGGPGGVGIKFVTGLTSGGTVSVTVGSGGAAGGTGGSGGAGGTSSFGAYVSATGGSGGAASAGTIASGGVGSGGDLNFKGPMDGFGPRIGSVGLGGNSYFGQGADGKTAVGNGNSATVGYGGGGGGSMSLDVARAGGAGAAGMVLVEW